MPPVNHCSKHGGKAPPQGTRLHSNTLNFKKIAVMDGTKPQAKVADHQVGVCGHARKSGYLLRRRTVSLRSWHCLHVVRGNKASQAVHATFRKFLPPVGARNQLAVHKKKLTVKQSVILYEH